MVSAGMMIGAYRVVHPIGQGGMGTVYLGVHALLGRRAAIKVLLPALSSNEELVARFFNEARAVTRISDPGIVQVFDFGHHADGSAFIVMELLEGEPIDARLRRIGRFGALDCVRLARLICTSLDAAHAKQIVHRDLKPENIFLVPDPAVPGGERTKILDFGIAKLSEDEPGRLRTRTDVVMGTPMFMSPEQCRGTGGIDHRSDIYAMGCVMFTMLTGRPPFEGMGAGELIAAHLREPPPLASSRAPGLPGVLDDILQCCLRKSPDERFGSMAELARLLGAVEQELLGGSPAGAATGPLGPTGPLGGARPPTAPPLAAPAPGRASAGFTPVPSGWTGRRPDPTTLNHASGQAGAPVTQGGASRRSARWVAVAVASVVAAVVIVAVVATGQRGPDEASSTAIREAPAHAGTAATAAPAPQPAAPPPAPPPAALPAPETEAAAPVARDAGLTDAPAAAAAIDGGEPPHRPRPASKITRPSSAGGDHDRAGSAASPHIDRGD